LATGASGAGFAALPASAVASAAAGAAAVPDGAAGVSLPPAGCAAGAAPGLAAPGLAAAGLAAPTAGSSVAVVGPPLPGVPGAASPLAGGGGGAAVWIPGHIKGNNQMMPPIKEPAARVKASQILKVPPRGPSRSSGC
jgi:hypothetical protein